MDCSRFPEGDGLRSGIRSAFGTTSDQASGDGSAQRQLVDHQLCRAAQEAADLMNLPHRRCQPAKLALIGLVANREIEIGLAASDAIFCDLLEQQTADRLLGVVRGVEADQDDEKGVSMRQSKRAGDRPTIDPNGNRCGRNGPVPPWPPPRRTRSRMAIGEDIMYNYIYPDEVS